MYGKEKYTFYRVIKMDKDSYHIKQFSANDIQRYHAGEMSPQEMHAVEKAALEDAFLSDAIEGYVHTTKATEDLEDIKKRLFEKETQTRVIPVVAKKRSIYSAFKVAAIVLFLAGAGWVVNQYSLQTKNIVAKNNIELKVSDSFQSAAVPFIADSIINHTGISVKEDRQISSAIKKYDKKDVRQQTYKSPSLQNDQAANEVTADIAMKEPEQATPKIESRIEGVKSSAAANEKNTANIYKGQVVDKVGNPVPFATILRVHRREGVTADANGNFSIATTDTMLLANISAAGFEPFILKTKDPQENYKVILQSSDNQLTEVVVTAIGADREQNEQSEGKERFKKPSNGLKDYDIYLNNNIKQVRDNDNRIVKGQVTLSFDVNKKGEPINIKVEKSLHPACDEQAERLLREGPKWKQKGNKKGQLVVNF